MTNAHPSPPRVFLSYSHDTTAHKRTVRTLAERLRGDGIDARFDQQKVAPPGGWPRWTAEQIEVADFVLMVCTSTYARRFAGREEEGTGRGATWEGAILRQTLYEAGTYNAKLIPLALTPADAAHIPMVLRGHTWHVLDTDEGYAGLLRHLKDEPEAPTTPIGPGLTRPAAQEETPRYENEAMQRLSEELEAAYRRRETLVVQGLETAALDEEIKTLRRRIRDGRQLRAGDFLCDGRFKLIAEIGTGGFATVWKAYDRKRHQPVAIKVLHGQHVRNDHRRERLFRGARQMAALQHQGIVRVIEEKLTDDGYCFFVMEYLPGGDLRQAVLAGRIAATERLGIICQVGDALAHAHGRGLIHRDVKPANILLDAKGRPQLTDFDLVRAGNTTGGTRTGMLGTVIYTAPEVMARGQDADERADVYGLAMTAVFVLQGKDLPMDALRDAPGFIARLTAPEEVRAALKRATAWKKEERTATVAALCAALQAAEGDGQEVKPRETVKLVLHSLPGAPQPGQTTRHEKIGVEPAHEPGGRYISSRGQREWWRRPVFVAACTVLTSMLLSFAAGPISRFFTEERLGGVAVEQPEMITLEGGTFQMGSTDGDDYERPVHRVEIASFQISKTEVTVAQYRACFEADVCEKPDTWGATSVRL